VGSREKVAEYLSRSGIIFEIREFEESTKNSALAAQALGCSVAEIAKSVVFLGAKTAVVILSGDKKVDPTKLAKEAGGEMRIASADDVRERTGFPIGGVPPFPHNADVLVYPDRSLTRFDEVWAAAGTPNAVVKLSAKALIDHVGRGPFDLSYD
jgi:prolyl-tRNA editing enzyme YbaK/EbsC (Cys-tRNA(Pro) deacylase)